MKAADGTERFYATTVNPIPPSQYAVIGPKDTITGDHTYIGRLTTASGTLDPTDNNVTRQIRMTPDTLGGTGSPVRANINFGASGPLDVPDSQLQTSVPISISTAVSGPRRLNISEPDGGYSPAPSAIGVYSPPLSVPLDYPLPSYTRTDTVATALTNGTTTLATAVQTNGTTTNIAIVHLQRLANPLIAYNATVNPYRTIDSMPIDLVAFNGWDVPDVIPAGSLGQGASSGTMMVASHQRGETTISVGTNNLWAEGLASKTLTSTCQESALPTPPPTANNFPYVLHHSMGFMNRSLGFPDSVAPEPLGRRTTAPNLGDPNGSATSPAFPWLTWSNRPPVSQLELLQVPSVKSWKLPSTFSITTGGNPYAPAWPGRPSHTWRGCSNLARRIALGLPPSFTEFWNSLTCRRALWGPKSKRVRPARPALRPWPTGSTSFTHRSTESRPIANRGG